MRLAISLLISVLSLSITAQDLSLQDKLDNLSFRLVGPSRGGRSTAVAGVESQPSLFYMGTTGGGVWKTTDYGRNWKNVSDGYFETGSIGAIRVYQNNPDIIYVGTGSDGIRSNVIIGKGVYKSNDAGETWVDIGLKKSGQIGAVEIHPQNPDLVYVAAIGNPFGDNAERGVFRSKNGGESWEKVLFISESTGACDLEINPADPDIIYASVWSVRRKPWTIISGSDEGGVYRSTDGGDTWKKLTNGLPGGLIGKSDLAVCKSSPDYLYVLMEASDNNSGLFLSKDKGESFELVTQESYLLDRPFYYTNIDTDPGNKDIVYVNSTGFYKSTDGGKTWTRRSTPHGDNHDMWINPSHTDIYIQSNDGGANITTDGGLTWSTQSNQPTAELYQVNVDDQVPYWLYAGQQDNSTVAIPSVGSGGFRSRETTIMSVGGCETGPAIPKPGDHNIVYSNCKGRFGRYNKVTQQEKQYYVGAANMYGHNPADLKYRFQRVSPIIVSPHNPDIVYHASQFLHRTKDEGVTWETISPDLTAFEPDKQVVSGSPITRDITGEEFYSTIYSVAESPLVEGVIWTGANDGPVFVTRNSGETWTNVTPDIAPGGRVQTIEASAHNPAKAYVAIYRYMLDDWKPYIYKTVDYGATWTLITSGIPESCPTRVVREDPEREGLLFAGTESGIFISFNDGISWERFQFNLPVVTVTDIKIFRNDLILSTMGRSFWIMDNISLLHQLDLINNGNETVLFTPRDKYRNSSSSGAQIDYYLASDAESVDIDIIDNEGNLLRSFSSGDSTQNRLLTLAGTSKIQNSKGFHRVEWDLRTYGSNTGTGRRAPKGPAVIPAVYRVQMIVDGQLFESSIDVLPDPKLIHDGMTFSDYREQFEISVKVRDLIIKAVTLTSEVNSRWLPLNEKKEKGDKFSGKERRTYELISSLRSELVTEKGRYPQPMLNDQLNYLYSMISRTDQKPGEDAYVRFEELENIYLDVKAGFEELGE